MKPLKIVTLLLITALSLLLVACGGAETPSNDQAASEASAVQDTSQSDTQPTDTVATTPSGPVDEEGAIDAAHTHAGLSIADSSGIKVKSDVENGVDIWDVEFVNGGFEYWYEINKDTGEVVDFGKESVS